jgi:bacillithiol biosynthesis cysteine-adding enzyme BshC
MPESGCREQSEKIRSRFEDVPFSAIPRQSKLFLRYLSASRTLRKYYPSAVSSFRDLKARKDEVLANHRVDRDALCDVLHEQNGSFGGGLRAAENIARLRKADCVAVLTGQQAGLFTGPLYTIYKALSAVRTAEELSKQGINAVPVFWIATEDHDLEEVSNAIALGADGRLAEARFSADESDAGKPVGTVRFENSIGEVVDEWFSQLPKTAFTDEIRSMIGEAYSTGESFGRAFGCLLSRLLVKYGLIVFDPLDARVKRLSSLIAEKAIGSSSEIVDALINRSNELTADGFHAQVLVEENYFPLFWHDDAGRRVAIKRSAKNNFRIAGTGEVDADFLAQAARETPERFSAGVMLRPVVQDYLFPTICYLGGGAEIAYFAQNSEVYRLLERPVTPIFHRQSFTIVETRNSRTLEKYGLEFTDIFRGFDSIVPEVIERMIDPETPRVFADAEERINTELNRLDIELSKIDPTLAESLAKRRRKIVYHIAALYKKYGRTRLQKDEVANRRLNGLFASLYPNGALQERTLNVATFANQYGTQFLDWVYDSIDVENRDHRLIYF